MPNWEGKRQFQGWANTTLSPVMDQLLASWMGCSTGCVNGVEECVADRYPCSETPGDAHPAMVSMTEVEVCALPATVSHAGRRPGAHYEEIGRWRGTFPLVEQAGRVENLDGPPVNKSLASSLAAASFAAGDALQVDADHPEHRRAGSRRAGQARQRPPGGPMELTCGVAVTGCADVEEMLPDFTREAYEPSGVWSELPVHLQSRGPHQGE